MEADANTFNINSCTADRAALLLLDSPGSLAATAATDRDVLREILLSGGGGGGGTPKFPYSSWETRSEGARSHEETKWKFVFDYWRDKPMRNT